MNTTEPTHSNNPTAQPLSAAGAEPVCSLENHQSSSSDDRPSVAPPPKPQKPKRMRRSSRPTGSPRAKCSRASSPHAPKSQSAPRRKSKPFEPLPEFERFAPEELAELHHFIRHHTYHETLTMLRQEYGIEISLNRLFRYRSRLDFAEQLQIAKDNAPAIENLLGLLAGKPVDIDAVGLAIIKQRALGLAASATTAPSLLMNLFRIFTWEHRKTINEQRMLHLDRRESCRERMTAVAERRQEIADKVYEKVHNQKGLTPQEEYEGLREVFGEFPAIRPFSETPAGTQIGDWMGKDPEYFI